MLPEGRKGVSGCTIPQHRSFHDAPHRSAQKKEERDKVASLGPDPVRGRHGPGRQRACCFVRALQRVYFQRCSFFAAWGIGV